MREKLCWIYFSFLIGFCFNGNSVNCKQESQIKINNKNKNWCEFVNTNVFSCIDAKTKNAKTKIDI